jgi:hypothetical protein
MKIYFDKYGNFKKHDKAYFQATSFGVDTIDVYADFDTTNYIPNITFRRADGFIIGPLKMNPIDGGFSRLIDFESILAIKGPLEITVRYEKYMFDSALGEDVLLESKVCAIDIAYVFENIPKTKDVLNEILKKIDKDELLDGDSAYDIAVKNGFVGTEKDWLESLKGGAVYHRGEIEPELKKGIWFDENVEGVGMPDTLVLQGSNMQSSVNVSGNLTIQGDDIELVDMGNGQYQIQGDGLVIVNSDGTEEVLIDTTITVTDVDFIGGTKYTIV